MTRRVVAANPVPTWHGAGEHVYVVTYGGEGHPYGWAMESEVPSALRRPHISDTCTLCEVTR